MNQTLDDEGLRGLLVDDDPGNDDVARDAISSRLFPSISKPQSAGRFELRGVLGRGGMGVVYRGYDPRLQRAVAIKLLRDSGGGPQRAERLEREARALAKLDHPNVVTVLEVGEHEGQTYVAMEFVEGQTLAAFAERRPSPAKLLDAYRQAGAGLAAAHQRGLIHRDFKPHNAMISTDGRARVLDFGLVGGGEESPSLSSEDAIDARSGPSDARLTETGAVLGTPAYMAPEQLRGRAADARTDQFCFCVSLWEGLSGVRPFNGDSTKDLLATMRQGAPEAPKVEGVQPRIWRALRRGLAFQQSSRWPTMLALLDELAPRGRSARGPLVAAGVATGVAALAFATWPGAETCQSAADAFGPVWSADRNAALRGRFAGHPHAATSWELVSGRLDAAANAWTHSWDAACDATPAVQALHHACLLEQHRGLAAMLSALEHVPVSTFATASTSVLAQLKPRGDCSAPAWHKSQPLPPADPVAADVDEIRDELAEVGLMDRIARSRQASERAAKLVERAAATGYSPVEAEARLTYGSALNKQLDMPGAVEQLQQAVLLAESSGHDRVIAAGLHELMVTHAFAKNFEASAAQVPRARAAIERLGSPPWMLAGLDAHEAKLVMSRGDAEGGMVLVDRATQRLVAAYGATDLRVALIGRQKVVLLSRQGRTQEALREVEAVLAVLTGLFGATHPALHQDLDWKARLAETLGRDDLVVATSEAVLASLEEPNLSVARAHLRLGRVATRRGETADATEHLDEAQRIFEEELSNKGPMFDEVLAAQANLRAVIGATGTERTPPAG